MPKSSEEVTIGPEVIKQFAENNKITSNLVTQVAVLANEIKNLSETNSHAIATIQGNLKDQGKRIGDLEKEVTELKGDIERIDESIQSMKEHNKDKQDLKKISIGMWALSVSVFGALISLIVIISGK